MTTLENLENKLEQAQTNLEAALERNDEAKFDIYARMVDRFENDIATLKGNS